MTSTPASAITLDEVVALSKSGVSEPVILALIDRMGRMYGFELLESLGDLELPLKEGTLYPLLNRMTEDGLLQAKWETENIKGHPRKFYSLTKKGNASLDDMKSEFDRMIKILKHVQSYKKGNA